MRKQFLAEIRRSQRENEPGVLIGVRCICRYTQIGHHTLKSLIEKHGFPATRLPNGRWCTSKRLIDDWIIGGCKPKQTDCEMVGKEDCHDAA